MAGYHNDESLDPTGDFLANVRKAERLVDQLPNDRLAKSNAHLIIDHLYDYNMRTISEQKQLSEADRIFVASHGCFKVTHIKQADAREMNRVMKDTTGLESTE